MTALEAISSSEAPTIDHVVPSIQTLAEILYLSAGITKRRSYPGGEILFRAAACTGALYHIDLYLVCGDLPGSKAGIYHFGPQDFALRRLRDGDYRNALVQASGREPAIVNAPVIIVCASTYWRNAWKYQSRAYRHCYWDTGTILANLLAAADARHMPARIVLGFVDAGVSRLLSLETTREGALTLVALGNASYQDWIFSLGRSSNLRNRATIQNRSRLSGHQGDARSIVFRKRSGGHRLARSNFRKSFDTKWKANLNCKSCSAAIRRR
jgi:SagB-type dehydrogenase family enzyme